MKTSKYKLKIICGFRSDQEYTIDANEAHKAYYLFANPDKKMVFNSGLAIKGSDIQRVVPDYVATMGWNADHKLTGDDYNEIHARGLMAKIQNILFAAKEIAKNAQPEEMRTPMIDLYKGKYAQLVSREGSEYAKKLLSNKT